MSHETDTWDERAEGWDENEAVRAYSCAAFKCLERFHREGRLTFQGARVLDFGCGTGLLAEQLAPLVQEVIALDTSGVMVRVLLEKLKRRPLPNVVAIARFPSRSGSPARASR